MPVALAIGSTLDNGRAYEIVDDSPIADFPDWLGDWCARNSVQERRPKQAHRDIRPVVEGFDPDRVLTHYCLNLQIVGTKGLRSCRAPGRGAHSAARPDSGAARRVEGTSARRTCARRSAANKYRVDKRHDDRLVR